MDNAHHQRLRAAQAARKDEFYTQYRDIELEINAYLDYNKDVFRDKTVLLPCDDPEWSNFTKYFAQNFDRLGLKKLISTSYAQDSKPYRIPVQLSLIELNSPNYDKDKTTSHGKIFTLTKRNNTRVDINNLKWKYLNGDGDFNSDEVRKLRDKADFIITNPPFSKFHEFMQWVISSNNKYLILGNINAVSYKDVFPLIKDNKMWLGASIHGGDREFQIPEEYPITAAGYRIDDNGNRFIRVKGVRWFTNMEHGRRHTPLQLMTMEDNLRYSRHKEVRDNPYQHFDNFNAINVPFTDAIPSDYSELMGVPLTFLDKYCPEQFDIVGFFNNYSPETADIKSGQLYGEPVRIQSCASLFRGPVINGKATYFRIIIKRK